MGFINKILLLVVVVVIGAALYQQFVAPDPPVPDIKELWFGKTKIKAGDPFPKDPDIITKFSINISNKTLQDLRKRLELARFVEPIAGTDFNYGFNGNYLKELIDYWKTKFDWRKHELQLNAFNQFKTQINGINVHFLHVKPSKPAKTVIPLLLVHGWPGSVWQYYKAIPLLIEPTDDIAFEVICPSIPGHGFSDAPQQEGFDVTQTALIFRKLMLRLNHKRFLVEGGDWGAFVIKAMAVLHPENIRGLHTNFMFGYKLRGMSLIKLIVGNFFPSLVFENPDKDYKKVYPILEIFFDGLKKSGYFHIQSTKPDTIGAALIDSPIGLAAYILDKFCWASDPKHYTNKPDCGLTEKFTFDELITNLMIYWTSNNLASSLRYYKESFPQFFTLKLDQISVSASVPSAYADFPNDVNHSPKALAEYLFNNLVQYTDMERGGHFAALEEPKLLCDDIRRFVGIVLENEDLVISKQ